MKGISALVSHFSRHMNEWVSAVAVLFSIASLVISNNISQIQEERVLRSELTDTLDKLATIQIEALRIQSEFTADINNAATQALVQQALVAFNTQNVNLLQQAITLANRIPSFVTWIDYSIIAQASQNFGDMLLAETYYQRAIEKASTNYDKGIAIRGYAGFLFAQNRLEEARVQIQAAVDTLENLEGSPEYRSFTLGFTYQNWAISEAMVGQTEEAERLLRQSCEMYGTIQNSAARQNAINTLNAAWQQARIQMGQSGGLLGFTTQNVCG